MRRAVGIAAGLGAVASFAVVVPGWAGPEFKNKYAETTVVRDCGEGDTVTYAGPEKMWPPNHKLQNVSVTATDGDGDNVTLEVADNVTDVAGGDGGPEPRSRRVLSRRPGGAGQRIRHGSRSAAQRAVG